MDQIVEVISSDSDIGENNEETRTVISGSSREISLREFIEIYEILPELWDPEDPLYRSKKKKKRNSVLDKVVIVFNKIKPNATHNDVRKKINILRSNYRKELKEILASKRSQSDVYKFLSWKFHSLKFSNKTIEAVVPSHFEKNFEENTQQGTQEKSFFERDTQTLPSTSPSAASVSSINKIESVIKKRNLEDLIAKQNELLSLARNYLTESKDYDYLTRAKLWAQKLSKLRPCQQLTVEKAINDILFDAELENLRKISVKIICDSYDTHTSSSKK